MKLLNDINRKLIGAGILLGIGMGGFVDGILFHQIFQLHSMLSNELPKTSVPNIQVNMFWDGVFHALTWITTAAGLALLWRAVGRNEFIHSTKIFLGSLIAGWGLFNFVEGIIDHHILHVHHVVDGPAHLGWDLSFLASGVIFMSMGYVLIKKGNKEMSPSIISPAKAA